MKIKELVFCVNCKHTIPKEYSERGGKFITGERVEGVSICSKGPYVDRCFKLNRWQVRKSYKQIEKEIKEIEEHEN